MTAKLNHLTQLKLKELIDTANSHYHKNFSIPGFDFSLKGTTAGVAVVGRWLIQLNKTLFEENEKEFLDQVIGHELAHLLAGALFGRKIAPHGKEWKSVMQTLGLRVETKHSLNVENSMRSSKIFKYVCACQEHLISLRKQNSMSRTNGKLQCKSCNTVLKYSGEYKENDAWKKGPIPKPPATKTKPKVKSTSNSKKVLQPFKHPSQIEYVTTRQIAILTNLVRTGKIGFIPFKGLTKNAADAIIRAALKL